MQKQDQKTQTLIEEANHIRLFCRMCQDVTMHDWQGRKYRTDEYACRVCGCIRGLNHQFDELLFPELEEWEGETEPQTEVDDE